MRLELLHAHRAILEFFHLAVSQDLLDDVVVLPSDFQGVLRADAQVAFDGLQEDGLLANRKRSILACSVYLLKAFFYFVELVDLGARVGYLHLGALDWQVDLSFVLVAETVLPGQDSLRVDLSILPKNVSVDYLRLAGDDVVESEVFVLEASWSLVLLFWVGLDVEEF